MSKRKLMLSMALLVAAIVVIGTLSLSGEDVSADTPETGISMLWDGDYSSDYSLTGNDSPYTYEIIGTVLTLRYYPDRMADAMADVWEEYSYMERLDGASPFASNTSITEVRIGPGSYTVLEGMFTGCSGITTVTTIPGADYSANDEITFSGAFKNSGISELSFNLPKFELTGINFGVQNGYGGSVNNTLTSIDLTGCVRLGTGFDDMHPLDPIGAFEGCTSLTTVTGLSSLTEAGQQTFLGCTSLTTVPAFGPNFKTIPDKMFMLSGLTSVDLSNSPVERIGEQAFASIPSMTSLNLGNVKVIGASAFRAATNLHQVTGDKVLTIGGAAFSLCSGLTGISFPNATTIGDRAFDRCTGVITVELPNAGSIGTQAFSNCPEIVTLSLPKAWNIAANAFDPDSIYEFEFKLRTIEIPNVMIIGDNAFNKCQVLEKVIIGKSVVSFGNDMFSNSSGSFEIIDPAQEKLDEQSAVIDDLIKKMTKQSEVIDSMNDKMTKQSEVIDQQKETIEKMQNDVESVDSTTSLTSSSVSSGNTLSYVAIACSVVCILLMIAVLVTLKKSKQ